MSNTPILNALARMGKTRAYKSVLIQPYTIWHLSFTRFMAEKHPEARFKVSVDPTNLSMHVRGSRAYIETMQHLVAKRLMPTLSV